MKKLVVCTVLMAIVAGISCQEIAINSISGVPEGRPGIDYPNLTELPRKTTFFCRDRQPGFYADPTTRCQVWHWCDTFGIRHSFICPNMTVFNQKIRGCDWWYNVNCDLAVSQYINNDELYKPGPIFKRLQQNHARVEASSSDDGAIRDDASNQDRLVTEEANAIIPTQRPVFHDSFFDITRPTFTPSAPSPPTLPVFNTQETIASVPTVQNAGGNQQQNVHFRPLRPFLRSFRPSTFAPIPPNSGQSADIVPLPTISQPPVTPPQQSFFQPTQTPPQQPILIGFSRLTPRPAFHSPQNAQNTQNTIQPTSFQRLPHQSFFRPSTPDHQIFQVPTTTPSQPIVSPTQFQPAVIPNQVNNQPSSQQFQPGSHVQQFFQTTPQQPLPQDHPPIQPEQHSNTAGQQFQQGSFSQQQFQQKTALQPHFTQSSTPQQHFQEESSTSQQHLELSSTPQTQFQQHRTPQNSFQQPSSTQQPQFGQHNTPQQPFQQHSTQPPQFGQHNTPQPQLQQHSTPQPQFQQHSTSQPQFGQHNTPQPQFQQQSTPQPQFGQHNTPQPQFQQHSTQQPQFGQHNTPQPQFQQPNTPPQFGQHNTPQPQFQQPNTPSPQFRQTNIPQVQFRQFNNAKQFPVPGTPQQHSQPPNISQQPFHQTSSAQPSSTVETTSPRHQPLPSIIPEQPFKQQHSSTPVDGLELNKIPNHQTNLIPSSTPGQTTATSPQQSSHQLVIQRASPQPILAQTLQRGNQPFFKPAFRFFTPSSPPPPPPPPPPAPVTPQAEFTVQTSSFGAQSEGVAPSFITASQASVTPDSQNVFSPEVTTAFQNFGNKVTADNDVVENTRPSLGTVPTTTTEAITTVKPPLSVPPTSNSFSIEVVPKLVASTVRPTFPAFRTTTPPRPQRNENDADFDPFAHLPFGARLPVLAKTRSNDASAGSAATNIEVSAKPPSSQNEISNGRTASTITTQRPRRAFIITAPTQAQTVSTAPSTTPSTTTSTEAVRTTSKSSLTGKRRINRKRTSSTFPVTTYKPTNTFIPTSSQDFQSTTLTSDSGFVNFGDVVANGDDISSYEGTQKSIGNVAIN